MGKLLLRITSAIVGISVLFGTVAAAETLELIQLPTPKVEGGKPLMQVLKNRNSSRSFSPGDVPLQVLSNLLWAAFGINRPESGKRTAPSAVNWQEIDIYVATAGGLYLYDAKGNKFLRILSEDIRALTGRQSFVKEAPVNLIYVADFSRMTGTSQEDKDFYSAADVGFISENVYLFCSSEGLSTVVRGSIERTALAKAMKLRPEQKIILAQTIGYPKK